MSATPRPGSQPSFLTPGRLLRETWRWLRANLPQTIVFAIIGAAGGWAVNVYIMARRYEGYQVPSGASTPGQGNYVLGTITWVLVSSIVFGLFAYRRSVGSERFWRDVRALPGLFATMLSKDEGGRIHFLWAVAVALVLTQVLTPSISGALAVGVALTIPSVVGRAVLGLAVRLWHAAARAVQPGKGVRPPPMLAPAVAGMGTATALLLGFVVDDLPTKLVLAVAAAAAAVAMSRQTGTAGRIGVLAFLGGVVVAILLADQSTALADDGGWAECGASFSGWWGCEGTNRVLTTAVVGGVAAGAGAAGGGALGGVLAGLNVPPPGSDSYISWLRDLLEEHPELYDDERFWDALRGHAEAAEPPPTDAWGRELHVDPETGQVWWGFGDEPRWVNREEYERLLADQRREHGVEEPGAPVARDPWGHEVEQVSPGQYWAWWLDPPRVVSADELPGAMREAERVFAEEQEHQGAFRRETLEEAERDWQRRQAERAEREAAEAARRRELEDEFERRMDAVTRLLEESDPATLDELDRIWEQTLRQGGVTEQDLEALRALHRSGFEEFREQNEQDRRDWERIATNIGYVEGGAQVIAFGGRVAGSIAEGILTGGTTGGAITGAIYGGAEHIHEGLPSAMGNAVLSGASAYFGGRLENLAGGGVGAGVASNALANALEEGIRSGGDRDRMEQAAIMGGLGSMIGRGISAGASRVLGGVDAGVPAGSGGAGMDDAAAAARTPGRGAEVFEGVSGRTPVPDAPAPRAPAPDVPTTGARAPMEGDVRGTLARGVEEPPAPAGDASSYPGARIPGDKAPFVFKPPPSDDAIRGLRPGETIPREAMGATGYAPGQVAGLADAARAENVIVGSRLTNPDSMERIRLGEAEPKPVHVKPKTVKELDQYIGGPPPEDKGLVGFFEPRPPDPGDPRLQNSDGSLNQRLFDEATSHYEARAGEYQGLRPEIQRLQDQGALQWDTEAGILRHPNGKPYAGDIDPVYLRDANTGEALSGERYLRVLDRLQRSGAEIQHGAETNMVMDLLRPHTPGTPEYEEALQKALRLNEKLAGQYTGERPEVVVEMWPDGVLRRGAGFQLTQVEV